MLDGLHQTGEAIARLSQHTAGRGAGVEWVLHACENSAVHSGCGSWSGIVILRVGGEEPGVACMR
jgi:hypothetical protein